MVWFGYHEHKFCAGKRISAWRLPAIMPASTETAICIQYLSLCFTCPPLPGPATAFILNFSSSSSSPVLSSILSSPIRFHFLSYFFFSFLDLFSVLHFLLFPVTPYSPLPTFACPSQLNSTEMLRNSNIDKERRGRNGKRFPASQFKVKTCGSATPLQYIHVRGLHGDQLTVLL